MRLTVGGVLLLVGAGAVVGFVVADGHHLNTMMEKIKGLPASASSLTGFFKSEEPAPQVPELPPVTANPVVASTDTAGMPLTEAVPLNDVVPVTPIPEPTPQVVAPKKSVKKARRKRVKPVVKKGAPKPVAASRKTSRSKKPIAKAPAPPAAAKAPSMVGTYVSLELITGRSVQGILESKTATHYVLNVPGLGPLEYPIENVKSIVPAQ